MYLNPHCRIKSVTVRHDRLGSRFMALVGDKKGVRWGMYELEDIDYNAEPAKRRYGFYGWPEISFGERD